MIKYIYLLIFVVLSNVILCEDSYEKLFLEGSEFYQKEDYNSAINNYTNIINAGFYSFEVYYNLGNSYYKMGNLMYSKLYYEKAKKLNADDEELNKNLNLVNSLLVDKIEKLPESFMSIFFRNIFEIMKYQYWGYLAIVLSILVFVSFVLYRNAIHENSQRVYFTIFIFSIIFSIVSLFVSIEEYSNSLKVEAIIFSPNSYIKSEPKENSEDVFILHEGTKVKILSETLDKMWLKIKIEDGKIGWIKSDDIAEI